jgi:hypothetical protein
MKSTICKILFIAIIIWAICSSCDSEKMDNPIHAKSVKQDLKFLSKKRPINTFLLNHSTHIANNEVGRELNYALKSEHEDSLTVFEDIKENIIQDSKIVNPVDIQALNIAKLENMMISFLSNSDCNCEDYKYYLESITNLYFKIIHDLAINDSVNIYRLRSFEPDSILTDYHTQKIENDCSDHYNIWMELIDEKTDIYYEKLQIIFGEN